MIITLVSVSNPSISTNIWLRVCSRSSWLPPSPARAAGRPLNLIDKNMQGEWRLLFKNRSRTGLHRHLQTSPQIQNRIWKKRAHRPHQRLLLPITFFQCREGQPIKRLWVCARQGNEFLWFAQNSTTSRNSSLDSSTPATSSNVTLADRPVNMRAAICERKRCIVAALSLRKIKKEGTTNNRKGKMYPKAVMILSRGGGLISIFTCSGFN